MSFQIHIIGSGSASPIKGRHHSAQVIKVNQHHYLIDCGEGTQFNLVEQGVNMHKLEGIFISHLHGDHYLGVVGLLSTMGMLGRKKPLHLFAPYGLGEIITTHFRISGTILEYPLHLKEFKTAGRELLFEDNEVDVFTFPLQHGVDTQGFLFQEKLGPLRLIKEKLPSGIMIQEMAQLKSGQDVKEENGNVKYAVQDFTHAPGKAKSYAYCSDTEFSETVIDFIKGADLIYHESTYLEQHKEKAVKNRHSTAREAAIIAKNAGVGKLAIGHLSSRYEHFEEHLVEAKKEFLNTVAATEGAVFVL